MQISPKVEAALHEKLPIDADEKILAIYKHHWFAYAASWLVGIALAIVILALATALTTVSGGDSAVAQYKPQILGAAGLLSLFILLGTALPVYLRSQEQVVLTEEALVQVLRPSLFSSKIDQLSLQHITDVSVHQDFFGTMFGFGSITLETPGEQDNYNFYVLSNPHHMAREIIAAHENFDAALQAGRMPSTLGTAALQAPQIDPKQYEQFLQYQKMVAKQQSEQAAQANDPTGGQQSPGGNSQSQ